MKRHEFITLVGGAAAWPLAARAQQPDKVWRIGYLGFGPASSWANEIEALRGGLRDRGYVEGKNTIIEFRWAERADQTLDLATQLVRMNVDVIFAPASTQVEPARTATKTIPIVFAQHADPVGLGDVVSLSRPGGNVTGLSMLLTELSIKELEILRETLPQATRIGVLWNPTTPSHPNALKAIEAATDKLGAQLIIVPAGTVADFEGAFATMTRDRAGGVLVLGSPLSNSQRTPLVELQLKHRLPEMFGNRENVVAGGLMSYGADLSDLYRRAAIYIDKILKGTNPADLPVEQASKYVLAVNLKTAKLLGLTMPPSILARADEVIE
jgi:putative ABC transport system substrate-binding protein